jgi:transcriptional regulator with XRE-family HTH domain
MWRLSSVAVPRSKKVFNVGSSLRQARERRGLELADVERDTCIRVRYLRALEEERFELLPGRAYARGFLRTYAHYLGLDADRFVDELASRLPPEEEAPIAPAQRGERRRLPAPAPLAAILLVAAAAVAVWVLGRTSRTTQQASPPPEPPVAAVAGRKHVVVSPTPSPRDATTTLVLRAAAGRCWIEADAGFRGGERLYYSTLEQGRSLRLARNRIWLRIGAPVVLTATLNGKRVALPQTQNPVDVLVTRRGVHLS